MASDGFDEACLLTGYPAFGARQMLTQIVSEEPRTRVYVVVKNKLGTAADEHLATLTTEQRERVVVLDGDAASMDLGLSGAEFRELTQNVTRIHHCAQVSYLGVDNAEAERVNVQATREVLEIAHHCARLRLLVHHSTAFVAGDRTGTVHETELDADQGFRNIVEETKARAERLVRRSMATLPIAVVRPTSIVGDTVSGEVDRLDGPYLLVLLLVTSPADIALPLPAKGDAPLHLVPVDFVTRAAHHIGRDPRAAGRTFHLADPRPLTAMRAFELIAYAAGRRSPKGFIPANLTRALLHTPGLEKFAKSPRTFLDQLVTPVRFDTRNADTILAGTGIVCPPLESYVDKMVTFVRERVRERRERRAEVEHTAEKEIDDPLG
ncbi:MAG: SDR family oxidoreductase [Polyangiaceae bacterium]